MKLLNLAILLVFFAVSAAKGSVFNQITYKQLTNIQTMYIETFDNKSITDKKNYKLCRIVLVSDTGVVKYDSVGIRGRGNASWGFAKKPYRIKFPKKTRLLGKPHAKAKSWTLLSNGGEKLLFRNGLANYVSGLFGLPFVPAARFIDLYINGDFKGNYQISDQVQVHKNRVEIYEQEEPVSATTDVSGGYFCEVDGYTDAGETYFKSPVYGNNVRVHSPKPDVINDRQYNYIRNHVGKFEKALTSSNYDDPKKGYRQYMDSATFMGWYLTNEICANTDLFYSIYFYKQKRDNKLYLGPVWDFDLGFNDDTRRGNNGDVTHVLMADIDFGGGYFKNWFDRLKTDKWWKRAQYEAFHKLYKDNRLNNLMIGYADSIISKMGESIRLNYASKSKGGAGWSISAQTHLEVYLYDTYEEYVKDLKEFIVKRNAYIDEQFGDRAPFDFVLNPNFYYRIYNKKLTNFLIALSDSTDDATAACLRRAKTEQWAQMWEIRPVKDAYMLINVRTGRALADEGATTTRTKIITLPPDETDKRQLWTFASHQRIYYNLINEQTKNVLTNYNSYSTEGNSLFGYTSSALDATNDGRLWTISPCPKPNGATGVSDIEAQVDYVLSYSPASHCLHFNANNISELVFKAYVYNLSGLCVGTFRGDEEFDMSGMPDGTYIVNWQFAGRSHSTKFLKN